MDHAQLASRTAGMTTARWMIEVPVSIVPIDWLIPIQTEPQHLWDAPIESVDPFVHVVVIDGSYWIEDGHHRYYRAKRNGLASVPCRVIASATDRLGVQVQGRNP